MEKDNKEQNSSETNIFQKIFAFFGEKNEFLKSLPFWGILGNLLFILCCSIPYFTQRGKYYSLNIDMKFRINSEFNIYEIIFHCVVFFTFCLSTIIFMTFSSNDNYYEFHEIKSKKGKIISFFGRIIVLVCCLFLMAIAAPYNNKMLILLSALLNFLLVIITSMNFNKIKTWFINLFKEIKEIKSVKEFVLYNILFIIIMITFVGNVSYFYARINEKYVPIVDNNSYQYAIEIDDEIKIVVDQNQKESIICNIVQKNGKMFPDCREYIKKIQNYDHKFINIKRK